MGHDSVKGIDEARAPLCGPRLDRLPTTHWINRVFLLTSLAILFAWSNYVSGLVLAQLRDIGWIDATSSAMFSSVYMAGMLFGSLLGGVIGDSIGRRKSYLLFVGIHTISMYLAAVTPSLIMLIATRALMGFGLGALLVSLFASLAEYVPTSQRGKWMGRNSFIGNCGGGNRLSACRGHLSFCYCGDELEVDVFNPGDNVDHHLVVCSALLPGISEVA